jgi:hypothetical protein
MEQMEVLCRSQRNEQLECVQCLVQRNPEALVQEDCEGNLPLHVAADRWVPVPILERLVDQSPDALTMRNHRGLLPVHLRSRQTRSAIPETRRGGFPAYMDRLEIESVQLLVEHWPESVWEPVSSNMGTLVHDALTGPPTPGRRVVLFLLQQCPEAALAADAQGLLSLHVAASTNAPLDLLYSMVHLQQGLVRAQAGGRGEDRPSHPSATEAATAAVVLAAGPSRSKRSRGETQP